MSDPYNVLGISRDANPDEIKAAFRKLAKQYHPDLNPGDAAAEGKFKEISAAYEALTNPQRAQSTHDFGDPFAGGFNPFHGFRAGNIRDIEEFLRAQAEHQHRTMPNAHLTTHCAVSLEQLFTGCELQVQLNMPNSRPHKIHIPPGLGQGQRIRVPGAGRTDNPNMPPGDLLVVIHEQDHDRFVREGADLVMEAKIDALEAIIGLNFDVVGIDGKKLTATIPPGTQYGTQIRITGEGMPIYQSSVRGDLRLFVTITTPTSLEERHVAMVETLSGMLPKSGGMG